MKSNDQRKGLTSQEKFDLLLFFQKSKKKIDYVIFSKVKKKNLIMLFFQKSKKNLIMLFFQNFSLQIFLM